MAIYQYKAKRGATEAVAGKIEARNQDEAVELISRQGLTPISVSLYHGLTHHKGYRRVGKVRIRELYLFSRQLSNLLKSGIPILRALKLISEQTANSYFCAIVEEAEEAVKDGKNLSECLKTHPDVFSPLYTAMIQAGEEGGNLPEMLLRISAYLRTRDEIFSKVRSALVYPIFMACVGLATVVFILTSVMPRIAPLFANLGEALPIATRILMGISQFVRSYWIWLALFLFVLIAAVNQWRKTESAKRTIGQFSLRLPFFGDLILRTELTRFCATLELLIKSGLSLTKALNIAVPTLDNKVLQEQLARCQNDIQAGLTLGDSLKKVPLVPVMLANLISVGEESGNLDTALHDVADTYEQEINEKIKTVTTLLEPTMILVVGLIVGFIVTAMLLPIFQMDILAR